VILAGHFAVTLCAFPAGDPIPYANYARFVGGQSFFEEGPFPEYELPVLTANPLPGWDENVVTTKESAPDLPPPSIDMDTLIMTMRADARNTTTAYDEAGNELGRLVTDQVGEDKIDINAANAIVNETEGTIKVQIDGSLLGDQPTVTFSLVEATGIYESEVIVTDPGVGYAAGYFFLALDDDPNTSLQENILNAFQTGQLVGADVVAVWTGLYVPEPSAGLMLTLGAVLFVGSRSRRKY
jgi:hypothetical protein